MEIPVRKRAKGPSTVDIGEFTTFNRGPITSLFVALPSCTATLTMDQKSIGLFAIHAGGQYFDPACIPMGWPGNEVASLTWGDYYYSPASCPYDWTVVTTLGSTARGAFQVVTVDPQTTVAVCCPSGFMYFDSGHRCVSPITSNQVVTYIHPKNLGVGWEAGPVLNSTFPVATSAYLDGVQVWWQSSDEALLSSVAQSTPSTATMPLTITAISTTSPAVRSSASPATASSSPSPTVHAPSGLPTGAKIGIGISVPAVALVALLFGFIVWRRRSKNSQMELSSTERPPILPHDAKATNRHELDVLSHGLYELPERTAPRELG